MWGPQMQSLPGRGLLSWLRQMAKFIIQHYKQVQKQGKCSVSVCVCVCGCVLIGAAGGESLCPRCLESLSRRSMIRGSVLLVLVGSRAPENMVHITQGSENLALFGISFGALLPPPSARRATP